MTTKADIVIIGAGLTGLTIAYYLKKAGRNFILLEKENRAGGVINTVSEDGFIYESGPNTGVLSTPEIALLFEDLKDRCILETANPKAAKRYILKNGSWTPLPSGPLSAIKTPLFSLQDKFRILAEPFRKRGTDPDETVARLVRRRLGKSYLDYAVNPFVSGIYAGDPEKLVTRFALPKLYALEHNYGSFIRGAIAKARETKTDDEKKATREVFSVAGGLGNLINALVSEIGSERIITGCGNTVVSRATSGYKIITEIETGSLKEFEASVVITTAAGYSLPSILPFVPAKTMRYISELQYARVVQVSLGFKIWNGKELDAFGGLVPEAEKREILGVLFPSAIFKDRAPENGAMLSVFLGGIKRPDIIEKDDREIRIAVLKEIKETLFCTKYPELIRINRYMHAIPQYEKDSEARLASINKIQEDNPGLILAGNIRDGIGMADRVKQGKTIAMMFK